MKAIVLEKYGLPKEVLRVQEIDLPQPKEKEVLVKIITTSINDYDWSMVRGKPYLYRLMYGLTKPKNKILGMELSGIIEKVGARVSKFNVGDEVYGDISNFGFGTFGEYICVPEHELLPKPKALSFEEVVAIPHAATLAFQALQDLGGIKTGKKILINGGGGGVGTIGVQLAKTYQCHVTGVDSAVKLSKMRALGFDEAIDYTTTDFTQTGEQYDLILDCKSTKLPKSYLKALKKNGTYVTIGGHIKSLLSIFIWSKLKRKSSGKNLLILSLIPNKDLESITQFMLKNEFKLQIDGPYSFDKIPGLVQYFGNGLHQGKIVIKIGSK
ncbi:NAD(P)-dependent alcohol dehydrogenase [Algoriphagus lutimaris]|uniref:NAD(P)-dependent alcohol dehydrogenase n=1 Tax=Algoriphagus lutimaris TaxID=613197 RepID=UPI00196A9514|nr:NAD(P)-dependent alcohol dehydrogenase [Algoriphagus lutimaris]MBN3519429.1 NAD(P)-dependent alcohol dehydrogenase [Algoriphagus lutimaris]